MSLPLPDDLVRIGQLEAEPRNDAEVQRMLAMAHTRLADAQPASLSLEGRFTSRCNAAHAAALAILRRHGCRGENRYIVFQCLEHTLGWPARWRVLSSAHQKRNLAEYEGFPEIGAAAIDELVRVAREPIADVEARVAAPGSDP